MNFSKMMTEILTYKFSSRLTSHYEKRKLIQNLERMTGHSCSIDGEFLEIEVPENTPKGEILSLGGIIGILEVQIALNII